MIEVTDAHLKEACDRLNAEADGQFWSVSHHGTGTDVLALATLIAEKEAAAKYPPELVERMGCALRQIKDDCTCYSARKNNAIIHILAALDALKPPVDPIDEIASAVWHLAWQSKDKATPDMAKEFREQLKARGLHITEINPAEGVK
ncbi:hypothetical protein [Allopontixanthobacter sediminis]|uniref:Uncharacterized protein n=1 Tax=Allopontixanthobacter sediminis TaxID=1689985 RepID=A0A845AYC5_9SPHN|nr:hypothetical protein [Allopontixanthobacter sediminis]MXP42948.1 hypothetical protein [Allopontixanthobacter sediminis]